MGQSWTLFHIRAKWSIGLNFFQIFLLQFELSLIYLHIEEFAIRGFEIWQYNLARSLSLRALIVLFSNLSGIHFSKQE